MATLSDKQSPLMLIVAGVNGAGKSTLYEVHPELFSNTERINADEVLRQSGGDWKNPNDNFKAMSANLIAPIVFNIKNHKARQCTVIGDKYNTRHPILSENNAENNNNKEEKS